MKTITLKEACELLDKAIFLSLASARQDVQYHSWGFNDDPDECFLDVCWQDDEAQLYKTQFLEGDNQTVEIVGEKMLLIDEEGNKEIIGLVFSFADLETAPWLE